MILLLGAETYIGQAFASALRIRRAPFIPLAENVLDYTQFEFLFDYVRSVRADFLINAHGLMDPGMFIFTGNEGALLRRNTLAARVVARVCTATNTPLGHVSSGNVFSGARVSESGISRVERNLRRARIRELFRSEPARFKGFTEDDEPNCTFRNGPCSVYSGTMALAEESLRHQACCYIWRFCLPFNDSPHTNNFLFHSAGFFKRFAGPNSLSHIDECVAAALTIWERCLPYGMYNLVNPGAVTGPEILQLLQDCPVAPPSVLHREDGFEDGSGTRSDVSPDCILDTSKLRRSGILLRDISDALLHAIRNLSANQRTEEDQSHEIISRDRFRS